MSEAELPPRAPLSIVPETGGDLRTRALLYRQGALPWEQTTDQGNGYRLVYLHGDDLRYCHPWKTWLVWDGRRWAKDDTGEIWRRAKDTARWILHEAAQEPDAAKRKELTRWHLASEMEGRLRGMIALAAAELKVRPDELDADPFLLTVANGTIQLRTGRLHPHRPQDYTTKLCPVVYDPGSRSALWDRFLDHALPDPDRRGFLRRLAGYSLIGHAQEEVLPMLHGPTAAGKSTFAEAMRAALGDYGMQADFESFLARPSGGGPRNDIARLAGARFVASVEVDDGKRLAEGLVKQLTGGDTVTARFLYAEPFEFRPAFTLWLLSNHAPIVRHDDDAMWRRILRVPFEHPVPKADRDPNVKARLRDPAEGGPAVLAWAVAGCLEYQEKGLAIPAAIDAATEDYRAEMDPLREWVDECCELALDDPDAWAATGALRAAYDSWCQTNGHRPISGRAFAQLLRARGATPGERSAGRSKIRGWRGLRLVERGAP